MSGGCTVRFSELILRVDGSELPRQMRMLWSAPAARISICFTLTLSPSRNADTRSTCLLHPKLRIHSTASLLFYLLVIFALAVFYEYLRLYTTGQERLWRSRVAMTHKRRNSNAGTPLVAPDPQPLRPAMPSIQSHSGTRYLTVLYRAPTDVQVVRSLLYVANVALSVRALLITL
jgi:hypothetical protein